MKDLRRNFKEFWLFRKFFLSVLRRNYETLTCSVLVNTKEKSGVRTVANSHDRKSAVDIQRALSIQIEQQSTIQNLVNTKTLLPKPTNQRHTVFPRTKIKRLACCCYYICSTLWNVETRVYTGFFSPTRLFPQRARTPSCVRLITCCQR